MKRKMETLLGLRAKTEAVLIQGDPLNRNGELYETRTVPVDSLFVCYRDIKSNELKDPHYIVSSNVG